MGSGRSLFQTELLGWDVQMFQSAHMLLVRLYNYMWGSHHRRPPTRAPGKWEAAQVMDRTMAERPP